MIEAACRVCLPTLTVLPGCLSRRLVLVLFVVVFLAHHEPVAVPGDVRGEVHPRLRFAQLVVIGR